MLTNYKLKNLETGKEYRLKGPSTLVGRSSACQLIISQGQPSREHARVVIKKDGLYVEDLHSTNGTYVNNRKVELATRVNEGDVVNFSGEAYVLVSEDDDRTIVSSKLKPQVDDRASILVADEEDDEDATLVRNAYPLPAGWSSTRQDDYFKDQDQKPSINAINRLIREYISQNKSSYIAVLVVWPKDGKPMIGGVLEDKVDKAWSIGRSASCDFTINDPCISEVHAHLNYSKNGWMLVDNKSTNGISQGGVKQKELMLENGSAFAIARLDAFFRVVPNSL